MAARARKIRLETASKLDKARVDPMRKVPDAYPLVFTARDNLNWIGISVGTTY